MPWALCQIKRLCELGQLRQWVRSATRCAMPAVCAILLLQGLALGTGLSRIAQEAPESVTMPAQADVAETIERVLSGPEFVWKEEGFISSLVRQAKEKFFEFLGSVIESLFGLGIDSALVARVMVFVLAAILLLLAVKLLILYMDRLRSGGTALEEDWVSTQAALQSPSTVLDSARQLAAEGRFEEAMHHLYHGVLLWLDERELAGYEAGKTGGEYAREIRSSEAKSGFKELLRAFYPVAFGGRPASNDNWSNMQSAAGKIGALE